MALKVPGENIDIGGVFEESGGKDLVQKDARRVSDFVKSRLAQLGLGFLIGGTAIAAGAKSLQEEPPVVEVDVKKKRDGFALHDEARVVDLDKLIPPMVVFTEEELNYKPAKVPNGLGYVIDGVVIEHNKDGQYFHVDAHGKRLYKETFDEIGYFSEGFAWVKKDGQEFFIDRNGHRLSDETFDYVKSFYNGKAWVSKNGREFHIDRYGREVE